MKENPLEKIKKMIDNDLSIEEAFEIISWKEFESAVAEIFRLHGFSVRQNVYLNGTKKYQIDLVAENNLKFF